MSVNEYIVQIEVTGFGATPEDAAADAWDGLVSSGELPVVDVTNAADKTVTRVDLEDVMNERDAGEGGES